MRPRTKRTEPDDGGYDLLAVDLDGTLLDPKGSPHPADLRALQALVARGVHVSIVTGRLYSGTRASAESIGIRGPVACADGSHLVRVADHGTLVHHGIAAAHAVRIRDAVARNALVTFLFAEDAIVHDDEGESFLPYVRTWSNDVRRAPRVTEHDLWEARDGITAVVALGSEKPIQAAADEIRRDLSASTQVASFPTRGGAHWGLIARAVAGSKGSAMQWLCAHYETTTERAVCVGDWINDISMFTICGRAFAMGQAPDAVKDAATDVLEETNERGGGIARVIAELFGV